jgi:hypothetical protein
LAAEVRAQEEREHLSVRGVAADSIDFLMPPEKATA